MATLHALLPGIRRDHWQQERQLQHWPPQRCLLQGMPATLRGPEVAWEHSNRLLHLEQKWHWQPLHNVCQRGRRPDGWLDLQLRP
jgi:hypothetical protein